MYIIARVIKGILGSVSLSDVENGCLYLGYKINADKI